MRHPRQNPHGGARRQPQRGDGGGGDGLRGHRKLAVTGTSPAAPRLIRRMKRLIATPLVALVGGCLTPPPPPPPPYHAVGTEPFWNLLIDEHNLTFIQPDAQPIAQPTPRVIVGIAG